MLRSQGVSVVVLCLLVASAISQARADMIYTLSQSGGDVVGTGSGSLDLTDLTLQTTYLGEGPAIDPNYGRVGFGAGMPIGVYRYIGNIIGPFTFGPGPSGGTSATTATGPLIELWGGFTFGWLDVPDSYVSGTTISNFAEWDNSTLDTLGVTPGTYTWTWGSGAHADSFTLNIGTQSVPEPASLVLLGTGSLAVLGYARRRRRAAFYEPAEVKPPLTVKSPE